MTRLTIPPGHVLCPTCSGDKGWEDPRGGGTWDEYYFHECSTCEGEGHVTEDEAESEGLPQDMREFMSRFSTRYR